MKKQILISLITLSSILTMNAQQIPISGDGYHYYGPNTTWGEYLKVGGNGRETTNASVVSTNGNLHLDSKDGFATYLNYYSLGNTCINSLGGNVGINTFNPIEKLTIGGCGKIRLEDDQNGYSNYIFSTFGVDNYRSGEILQTNGSMNFGLNGVQQYGFSFRWLASDNSSIHYLDDSNELMRLTMDGKLGLGTKSPAYKLDVWGTIRAKEVIVEVVNCPDFVFKSDYKLMDLKKLEEFVKTNQHLPEIASEKEMVENGVNMKELQMKLLQKIEELTLYTIEQNKETKKLIEKVETLESKNAALEGEIKKMKLE